jgi:TPR repeat protein
MSCHYGISRKNGEDVDQNEIEAVKYFKLSADHRNSEGEYRHGICLTNGEGVEGNTIEAVKYFKISAD